MPVPPARSGAGGESRRSRRRFLGAGACGLAVGLAGCPGVLGPDGDSSTPEATVREFYAAVRAGERGRANSLLHPNATTGPLSTQQVDELSQIEYTIDDTSVVEREDDWAVVRVTITATVLDQTRTNSQRLEVRRHEGQWLIYSAGE